jgi:predicted aconitase with swiveling domain
MRLKGRSINSGKAEGEAIVYNGPFSMKGDLDPKSGEVSVKGHPLEGKSLAGKIFVFTTGRGSTVGPYIAYEAKKAGMAPAAMICQECEPIIALGAIMADIPMVDRLDKDPLATIKTGDWVRVDGDSGIVEIVRQS